MYCTNHVQIANDLIICDSFGCCRKVLIRANHLHQCSGCPKLLHHVHLCVRVCLVHVTQSMRLKQMIRSDFEKQKPQLLERNLQSRTNELQLFALNQNVFEDKSTENSTTVAQQLGINVFSTYKCYCCWSGNHFSLQMLRCFLFFYFRFDLMWNEKLRTFLLCG